MNIYHRTLSCFLWLAAGLTLIGCGQIVRQAHDPEMPYPLRREPRVGEILHIPTGTLVNQQQMLRVVTDARIVYVGETHDNPASHRLELVILEAMTGRHPGRVALGMEIFTPAQQPALDRWVAGTIGEKEFLKSSQWYENWGMDFDYYRPLLQAARDKKVPIIGLNAEKSLVRSVIRAGLADSPPELREKLPDMDMEDRYHRMLAEAVFHGHSRGGSQLEGFVRVQTLWDETMAQNIASYLSAPENAEMRMVVIAGGNHIRQGFGIPRRVFRRLPASYILVGSREIVIPEDKLDRLMDVDIPPFPMPAYDFLVFTEYEDLNKESVSLGVLLDEREDGVFIRDVLSHSAAQAAGLQKGDQLVRFDDQELQEAFDLRYLVGQKKVGDRGRLLARRDGSLFAVEVLFQNVHSGHGTGQK